ncbi:hypothetical protein K2X33_09515, partial [bacterium]|nr:hypothetical protein [bacterium]
AFTFGQRLPDILQLQSEDLQIMPQTKSLCVTIRRGKVIRWVQPYCLHLPIETALAETLLEIRAERKLGQTLFNETTLPIARGILKAHNENLEIRSVRRGGLQALALLGIDIPELRRNFSKHSTDQMLLRYLCHGAFLLAQANLHHHTAEKLLNC